MRMQLILAGLLLAGCENPGKPDLDRDGIEDLDIDLALTVSPGTYSLAAVHSGKCLVVAGDSLADGSKVQQAACTGTAAQQWKVRELDGGAYELTSVRSAKCLDVEARTITRGALIQQWACTGADNQKWKVVEKEAGSFELQAVHSGKCLDVMGRDTAQGAALLQWDCNGKGNQAFKLTAALVPPGGGGGGGNGGGPGIVYFSNDGVLAGWTTARPQGRTIGKVVEVSSPVFKSATAILTEQTYVRPQGAHSEVILGKAQQIGEDRYYGQAIYLPKDWNVINSSAVFQQFSPEAPSGPWILNWIQNDHIFINRVGKARDCGPIKVGEWTRIVMRLKTGNPGIFEYWVNGVKKWSLTDLDLTIPNGSPSIRWSTGIYVTWWREHAPGPQLTRQIYHDQLRIASTYEAADPGNWGAP